MDDSTKTTYRELPPGVVFDISIKYPKARIQQYLNVYKSEDAVQVRQPPTRSKTLA